LGRNQSLEFLKELRKNPDAVNQKGEIRLQLSIPEADYFILKIKYPILQDGSSAEKQRFWKWFVKQSESRPYRVTG
jgi:hypothetical protein